MAEEETLGEKLNYVLPGVPRSPQPPAWPADVFCLCAVVLHSSGAYSAVVDDRQAFLEGQSSTERAAALGKIGVRWRRSYVKAAKAPNEIQQWWKEVLKGIPHPISRVASSKGCIGALLNLLGAFDEACRGVGVYSPRSKSRLTKDELLDREFLKKTDLLPYVVNPRTGGSTLCDAIHSSKGRVLPRMHTPQNGLTVRSLSHHLAYCAATDITPRWMSPAKEAPDHTFNLLVIPWRKRVDPIQFNHSKKVRITDEVQHGGYGLFTYRLAKGPTVAYVTQLLSQAEKKVGPIHGVIFPELAMSKQEHAKISAAVVTEDRFLVAGAGERARSG